MHVLDETGPVVLRDEEVVRKSSWWRFSTERNTAICTEKSNKTFQHRIFYI